MLTKLIRIAAVIVCTSSAIAWAQSGNPTQVSTLLSEALAAFGKGTIPIDLTASGNAVWIVGTQQSGTAVFRYKGAFETRLDITTPSGIYTELRNDTTGPAGEWITPDGVVHPMPLHDCWTMPTSLSPLFIVNAAINGKYNLSYVGPETHNGLAVDHITITLVPSATSAPLMPHLSTMEIFLDQQSHLPLFVQILGHPDNDAGVDFPIEFRFASYQTVSGILVPFRIQRLVGGVLNLDFTISNVVVNSAISDNVFTLQ